MSSPVLLCSDGSPLAHAALAAGLALIGKDRDLAIVTVMEDPDPLLLTGVGFAGSLLTPEEFDRLDDESAKAARETIATTRSTLGLDSADCHVLRGAAGPAICHLAEETGAAAVVIGSRGRGGFKRAVLGSVSDHVVRNAPCPVLVTAAHAAE